MYEFFQHTADLGLRVRAASLNDLFCDAAKGLFAILIVNLEDVQPLQLRKFSLAGDAYDYLLFDWLAELLFVFDTEHLVLVDFDVQFTTEGIEASCRGEPLDPARHQLDHEIKAITYHQLRVERNGSGWLAEVIVDI